jgi:hypothetical protein
MEDRGNEIAGYNRHAANAGFDPINRRLMAEAQNQASGSVMCDKPELHSRLESLIERLLRIDADSERLANRVIGHAPPEPGLSGQAIGNVPVSPPMTALIDQAHGVAGRIEQCLSRLAGVI